MDGGPSQQHTFDPKPTGEFKSMSTSVPGIQIVEQLPQLASCMEDLAIVRSMSRPGPGTNVRVVHCTGSITAAL